MNPKGDVTLCSWYSHSRKPYRKGFYCSAILSLIGVRRDQSVTAFKIALSMVEKISEIAEPFQLERVVFYILKMVFLRVVSINSHNVTSCIGPYRV